MLQSRPITTLHDDAAPAPSAGDGAAEQPQTVLLRGLGGAPGSASGAARVLTSLADAAALGDGRRARHPHDLARLGAADAPRGRRS